VIKEFANSIRSFARRLGFMPSRLELDPSRSPAQPPDMVGILGVVGRGSGMEQVKTQEGWYNILIARV
jgi:hypothetical protein